ncbi:concanavalin A-like lectin/glucanase domain-containing protein [Mycena galopus ATCC 62051]|nr:concanavalin A-like lectin/glucanase domain-containing protein [Mycena galopus ATCC 62051]
MFTSLNFCCALEHTIRDPCQQLDCITFNDSEPASRAFYSYFEPISAENSYALRKNGLEIYLRKPESNDELGDGATINSTFTLDYGKVTFEVQSPTIAGVIVAGILIGDDSDDEIDIEFVCGEPKFWQTNLFVSDPQEHGPDYNVFSSKETLPDNTSIADFHEYSIEVNSESISWSFDGQVVRTLWKSQCTRNNFTHFPSHSLRLQLGIWDASRPTGTCEWAKGPINWKEAPETITATIKSVAVECDS